MTDDRSGDLENAYVDMLKYTTFVLQKIPKHISFQVGRWEFSEKVLARDLRLWDNFCRTNYEISDDHHCRIGCTLSDFHRKFSENSLKFQVWRRTSRFEKKVRESAGRNGNFATKTFRFAFCTSTRRLAIFSLGEFSRQIWSSNFEMFRYRRCDWTRIFREIAGTWWEFE